MIITPLKTIILILFGRTEFSKSFFDSFFYKKDDDEVKRSQEILFIFYIIYLFKYLYILLYIGLRIVI